MDKVFAAIFGIVVLAVLVGGVITLQFKLDSSVAENTRLSNELASETRRNAVLSQEFKDLYPKVVNLNQENVALKEENATLQTQNTELKQRVEEIGGILNGEIERARIISYIADKAFAGLANFLPETSLLWMYQDYGAEALDTKLIYLGRNRGFEIEAFQPERYGIKPNTPRGTASFNWGLLARVKAMDDQLIRSHIHNRLLELQIPDIGVAKLKDENAQLTKELGIKDADLKEAQTGLKITLQNYELHSANAWVLASFASKIISPNSSWIIRSGNASSEVGVRDPGGAPTVVGLFIKRGDGSTSEYNVQREVTLTKR